MNKYLSNIILLMFVSLHLLGQKKILFNTKKWNEYDVYKVTNIPFDGISLNKGWKFKLSDSLKFAKPAFKDNLWDTTNINKKLALFKIDKTTVGWFRKKIFIDSSLVQKGYVFKVLIAGAAEIYLNGELIQQIGKIGDTQNTSEAIYLKKPVPFSLVFKTAGEQSTAIRFLFNPPSMLAGDMDLFPLSLTVQKLDNFKKKETLSSLVFAVVDGICMGLFLMMTLIHFFFHYFFRSERYNILFGSSMFIFCIYFLISNGSFNELPIEMATLIFFLKKILFPIAHLILLVAVYKYLRINKQILFWAVVLFFLGSNIIIFLTKADTSYIVLLYFLLILNYIYLTRKSLKNSTHSGKVLKNAAITCLGLFVLLFLVFVFYTAIFLPGLSKAEIAKLSLAFMPIFVILIFVGPQLSVSAAISLSLAKEFVLTNSSLQQKIIEVETLSTEKQNLLTSQNELLETQVKIRTEELHQSIIDLKAAQNQLIQAEKLASLGELTAGIAHEIQNPLNFVNNFSELSIELIEEAPKPPKGASEDWIPTEAPYGGWGAFFGDLTQNLEKINHHGKRASSIVKGMLEHSRTSSGTKELTDINKLADEYLRLSYHGLRAKDKSFNANFELIADPNLPKINVIPQDIGRVLLNLINNAFQSPLAPKGGTKKVIVKTVAPPSGRYAARAGGAVITISDNGSGISADILPKIFQPFFTTKPTGQGTGLGLSLAYDIITKGHGGTIEVESIEGEGTTFTVKLPI